MKRIINKLLYLILLIMERITNVTLVSNLLYFADISIATLLIIYLTIVTSRDEFMEDGECYRTASDLTRVPRDIPAEAWKVYISSNAITEIEAQIFSNLSVCSYLRLSFNKISVIETGAFSGLEKLLYLYLDNNAITDIKANTFVGVESLSTLELGNNGINIIEAGAFGRMSRLDKLQLYGNGMTSIMGDMWQGIRRLSFLDLGGNSLVTIETGNLGNLKELSQLHLYKNGIKTINCGMFEVVPSLELLDLGAITTLE